MPQFSIATGHRSMVAFLSNADIERSARDAEDFDAACGETVDLLPLGVLVRVTERSSAA